MISQAFFLDVFPELSPTQVGETLSFSENSLSLFKRVDFFQKFPELSKFKALKLKFGQIFMQKISTSELFRAKSQF